VTIQDNLIADNHGPGLQLSDEDNQYPNGSVGYSIQRNTIVANQFGVYLWNFGQCPFPNPEIINFVENDIRDSLEQDIWCEP